jgi:hypothetical protein
MSSNEPNSNQPPQEGNAQNTNVNGSSEPANGGASASAEDTNTQESNPTPVDAVLERGGSQAESLGALSSPSK